MRLSYACYGNSKTFAQLNCHKGSRISVQKIVFGSKKDPSCPSAATVSTPLGCCIPRCGECLAEDPIRQASILERSLCDGKTHCSARAQRTTIAGCGNKPYSNYMVVMYDCIPDSRPLFASNTRNITTVSELLCAAPKVLPIKIQRPIDKPVTRLSPNIPMKPPVNVTPMNNKAAITSSQNNSSTRDLSREAAIIGGVTAGIVFMMVAVIVIVACVCSKRTEESEEEIQETKSTGNLSFIDPITMQPSYHAFGSVDGSSMTNYCGHADNQSTWSVETDQYPSAMNNNHRKDDPTRSMRYWFQEQSGENPVEVSDTMKTKRSPSNVSQRSEGSSKSWRYWVPPTTPDFAKQRHNLRQVTGNHLTIFTPAMIEEYKTRSKERNSKRSSSRSKQLHMGSNEHRSMSNEHRSMSNQHARIPPQKHSSLKIEDYHRHSRQNGRVKAHKSKSNGVLPDQNTMDPKNDYTSWWFLSAMRTNSDPARRFAKGYQDGGRVHFGSQKGADCRL